MKTKTNKGIAIFPAPSQIRESERIWQSLANLYNRMPLGITPCHTIREAKIYSVVLMCAFSLLLPPLLLIAYYLFHSAQKGGRK